MHEVTTFYNNEIITGIAILSVLKITKKLEITKALLIQPLLSYKGILEFIKRGNTKVRSIEELIIKKNIAFSNFNRRYLDSLGLSINAVLLLEQLNLIVIDDSKIVFNGEDFDFDERTLGQRAKDVILASGNIAKILLKEDASSLYLSLRIEI